jgi:hypothetical protein
MRGQVAIFLSAATVLADDWREWCRVVGRSADEAVFGQAITVATEFACGRQLSADPDLADAIEIEAPEEPAGGAGFSAAQDCWICLDTAVRGATEGYDAAS